MEDQGHVIPELQNKPELFPELIPYLSAFQDLTTSRQTGFGMGYIPYSEICSYLTENRIPYPDREEFLRWIRFIDSEYVSNHNKKQK
jgi:hypothetical protein